MKKAIMVLSLMPMMALASLADDAHGTAEGSFPDVTTWKFYEEADDDIGLNLAAWEDRSAADVPFWIGEGINMAIPVEGNFTADDVALVAGTYSDYGRPQVVSDEWLFEKHYTALKKAIGREPYGNDSGAYGRVYEDDVGGRNYSLSMDIWPQKTVVTGRKWILLEMGGRPTKGCKTFYLGLKGRDDAGYSRFRIYATPDQGVSQRPSDWSGKRELAVLPLPIGSGTTSGSGMYASGTRVSLSATPAKGYTFDKWSDGDTNPSRTVVVDANRVIYACFKETEGDHPGVKVFGPFVAGGKVNVDVGLVGYTAKGLPVGLKYNAKTGKVTGTVKTAGEYEVSFTKKGKNDETVVFTVRAGEVSVTFNAQGGSLGAESATRLVKKGKAIGTLPKPTRTGYTFKGWYTAKSGGTKIKTTTKVTKNVTYYAQWTASKYTIKFNANGGTGTMKALTATYGKDVTLTANAFKRKGWTFAGWATEKGGSVVYKNKAKVKDLAKSGKSVTLYAVWTGSTYTVKFDANGGDGDEVTQTVNRGSSVKISANAYTRAGFTFAGWATKKDGEVVYKDKAKVKDLAKSGESVTLYAVWLPAEWAVGTFTGEGEIDDMTATVTLTVASDGKISGTFVVWSVSSHGNQVISTILGRYPFAADRFTGFFEGALCVETTINYGTKKCALAIAVSQDGEGGTTVADLLVTYKDEDYGAASLAKQ